jgi:hypothetical protein
MNYFYDLPNDVQAYIIAIRNDECALRIQRIWRGRFDRLRKVVEILREFWRPSTPLLLAPYWDVNAMSPETGIQIEYCVKYANFEEMPGVWEDFLHAIEQSLWEDEYTGGRGAEFYQRTERAKDMLKCRLE